jgi:hypothetical protein
MGYQRPDELPEDLLPTVIRPTTERVASSDAPPPVRLPCGLPRSNAFPRETTSAFTDPDYKPVPERCAAEPGPRIRTRRRAILRLTEALATPHGGPRKSLAPELCVAAVCLAESRFTCVSVVAAYAQARCQSERVTFVAVNRLYIEYRQFQLRSGCCRQGAEALRCLQCE